ADPPGPRPLPMQQDPAPHRPSVGPVLCAGLPVGRGVLQTKTHRRQKPRLRPALPGPAAPENPLADDPDPQALRRGPARPQPKTTRFLGAGPHETRSQSRSITPMKKPFTSQRTTWT